MSLQTMVAFIRQTGLLTSRRVEGAMLAVDRALFMPPGAPAYEDRACPVISGQTISAPGVVAFMLERLDIRPGMSVLEIGTGTGYNAALLSHLAGPEGKVVSIEILPELHELAVRNLSRIGAPKNITLVLGDGSVGYKKEAPYDRIIATAGMPDLNQQILDQLKKDGKMVAPVGGEHFQDLVVFDKKSGEQKRILPVVFVPLRGEKGFK
jgi:protein-L-isoaspartate(D-aspartate) O-methyltransferase